MKRENKEKAKQIEPGAGPNPSETGGCPQKPERPLPHDIEHGDEVNLSDEDVKPEAAEPQ